MKKPRKNIMYTAIFTREKDGSFSVSVPDLPGCFSQGETYEEAVRNIHEAIDLYLEDVGADKNKLYAPYRSDEQFLCKV